MNRVVLATRLRVFRAAHHLTQVALAERLGISQTALSLLENNKRCPQVDDAKLAMIVQHIKKGAL